MEKDFEKSLKQSFKGNWKKEIEYIKKMIRADKAISQNKNFRR